MCVALAALEAVVHVAGPGGTRAIPFADFHRLPGDEPQRDNHLAADELITEIELPPSPFARHSAYLKIRDRASYAFALVSVAAACAWITASSPRRASPLGGVAHKPWRQPEAEAALVGKPCTPASFRVAADRLLQGPRGWGATISRWNWPAAR